MKKIVCYTALFGLSLFFSLWVFAWYTGIDSTTFIKHFVASVSPEKHDESDASPFIIIVNLIWIIFSLISFKLCIENLVKKLINYKQSD